MVRSRAAAALSGAVTLLGWVAVFVAAAAAARAHSTDIARLDVAVDGATIRLELAVSAHDLAVALDIPTDLESPVPRSAFADRRVALERYLESRLRVRADGAACPVAATEIDGSTLPETLTLRRRHLCPHAPDRLSLAYALFFDVDSAHRALGSLTLPGGAAQPFLFDRRARTLDVDVAAARVAAQGWAERLAGLVRLGAEHILIGVDHVLFLLALVLAAPGVWAVVKIVTAFTLAHSVTLGLAWYGVVAPPARLVEVVIALSILVVALDNIRRLTGYGPFGRRRPETAGAAPAGRPAAAGGERWAMAGLFGLVHGFGFYGVLSDLPIAGGGAALTLLGFNLGVELGQLAIVLAALALLAVLRPWRGFRALLIVGSAGTAAIALYWAVTRALG